MEAMQQIEEKLFQCWCRHGDAQALGELFDFAAPQLLKLAIHLVGDAAAAEDLVQASFVALIEQRAKIDTSRPVMPWLSGVLSNKAQQLRRERAKTIDVDRLHKRAAEEPSAALEQRELSGELAEAIDRLGDPYRQVLLLRVRHGMELADIAHVLERDQGTVSVQLHRGIERLRRRLPAALTSSLLVGLFATRGLAAIKASVLSQASAAAAVTSLSSIVGGLLVGKKTVVALCLILLALLFYTVRSTEQAAVPQSSRGAPSAAVVIDPPKLAAPTVENARTPTQPDTPSGEGFTATVIDAETGAPLPNANVALFAGRETTSFELMRDHPEYYRLNPQLESRTCGDWPRIVGADEVAFAGRREFLSLDKPEANQKPLARTTSDSKGRFTLPCMAQVGLIEVSLASHLTRWRPFVAGKMPTSISMWREREITGEVIFQSGERITESIVLALAAAGDPSDEAKARYMQVEANFQSTGDRTLDREGLELQRVTTASDGTFRATVGDALDLSASLLSPGWTERGTMRPDQGSASMKIVVERVPLLHFFDEQSKQPIEHLRIFTREMANGYARRSNEVFAPGGLASCPESGGFSQNTTLIFTAWASEFEPAQVKFADHIGENRIEVPMHAGVAATLEGHVMRGEHPVESAMVAVLGHSPLAWSPEEQSFSSLLDATTTVAGAFRFTVPAGKYVLHVRDSASEEFLVVDAPTDAPIVINLDHLGAIEIEVVDQSLAPRASHVVGLHSQDGRSSIHETNASGKVVFDNLPPGRYTAMASNVSSHNSFHGDASQVVELEAGQHASVQLETVASIGPRHARIHAKGTGDYTGWRARYSWYEWNDIAREGTIPMDLATDAWELEIAAPDGRNWSLEIPNTAPDGYVIELDAGDARLEGELVDAEDHAIVGVTITAQPKSLDSSKSVSVSATSDADGKFVLGGLARGPHVLRFERGEQGSKTMIFTPNTTPSTEPTWLRIQLFAPTESVRVNGTVRDRAGKPQAGVSLCGWASIPQAQGVLGLANENSFTSTDSEGRFQLTLPRAPNLKLTAQVPYAGSPIAERELTDDGSAERTVDLTTN